MIRIDKSGIVTSAKTQEQKQHLREVFDASHFLRLPDLISPELLEELYAQILQSSWEPRSHEGIGEEVCINDHAIEGLINFLLNDQELFALIEGITGCSPIGSFAGRVYRMVPGSGHFDSWHSDFGEYRMLALTINLSKETYQGGTLEIRQRATQSKLRQIPNTEFGHAILFRLDSKLEHRVTNIEGNVPKTAFAGWFRSEPKFWESFGKI